MIAGVMVSNAGTNVFMRVSGWVLTGTAIALGYVRQVSPLFKSESNEMLYSHIYKTRGGFVLILTRGAEINTGVISETQHADKRSAKAAAKAANATPWNY